MDPSHRSNQYQCIVSSSSSVLIWDQSKEPRGIVLHVLLQEEHKMSYLESIYHLQIHKGLREQLCRDFPLKVCTSLYRQECKSLYYFFHISSSHEWCLSRSKAWRLQDCSRKIMTRIQCKNQAVQDLHRLLSKYSRRYNGSLCKCWNQLFVMNSVEEQHRSLLASMRRYYNVKPMVGCRTSIKKE